MASQETVGFVGAGLMGHGIAANILKGGYPLSVIAHRSRSQVEDLVGRGATEVGTLAEMGAECSVVFLCVPASPQVEATVHGLLEGLKAGSVVVDCSTSDPVSTGAMAELLASKGIAMADAPLGGTPVQAEAGELSAMVGADPETFARIEPVIAAWAKTIRHLGPVGDGHKMKLLNNFLSLGYAAIYSEALALSRKVGIPVAEFDKVIRGGRMDCGFYQTFMGYALEGNREAHKFTLGNAYKDMRYVESMANFSTVATPMASAVKNSFALAMATGGNGAEDYVPHLSDFIARANGL